MDTEPLDLLEDLIDDLELIRDGGHINAAWFLERYAATILAVALKYEEIMSRL